MPIKELEIENFLALYSLTRKALSRAVRNYLALHSYTAERLGNGLYNIYDAEGDWHGEILYCYSVEEIIEITGGLVIGGLAFPDTPEEPW